MNTSPPQPPGEGSSPKAPAGPVTRKSVRRAHPLPHRVRLHRAYVFAIVGLLTPIALVTGFIVVSFDQLDAVSRAVITLSFLFCLGLVTLSSLGQTYTLTEDALARFLPLPDRTVRYADLLHVEVQYVHGKPVLTLQRREGREARLTVTMVDPAELLFTLDTLAERAPAAVLGPEALRLREQATNSGG